MAQDAPATITIRHATSSDGTTIGWRQLGSGPAIVVMHGAIATGEQWLPVAHALADEYTMLLVDRRGRGLSGDAEAYDLSTEVADLEAVLAVAGPGATVLGHSYGAITAAATVAAGAGVSALVLYEPPLPVNGSFLGTALAPLAAAVAAGENERVLSIMLTDIVHTPEADVDALRQTTMWAEMVALAPTLERELRVVDGLAGDVDRFTTIRQPTLLLLGSDTAQHHVDATRFLTERLPHATLVELPGQEHFAHATAPTLVADVVRSFLRGA
ncbi:alpha/beta fold hydrolase [Pseudonocardia alaniniphila]|uniref:Alpha/beta hydrolase n=1 Tax=Pseudonocardia alaniniphila TaxID=75291 RepID=A0ABS9TP87_9PSEU|nr:alpha/beta hydrolase [Pseudonocardia alaniniphila]MCH6170364.1 alpha/beta hydrolase [Pseudonocardia alaniniphila]